MTGRNSVAGQIEKNVCFKIGFRICALAHIPLCYYFANEAGIESRVCEQLSLPSFIANVPFCCFLLVVRMKRIKIAYSCCPPHRLKL